MKLLRIDHDAQGGSHFSECTWVLEEGSFICAALSLMGKEEFDFDLINERVTSFDDDAAMDAVRAADEQLKPT